MNKLIILSNEKQFNAALGTALNDPDVRIICDNRNFDSFLKQKNVAFTAVGDIDIKPLWKNIDTWSCEKALLSDSTLKRFSVGNMDIGDMLYPWFSYYLNGFLRSYLLASHILKEYKPSEIILFENIYSRELPLSNTNYFLNLALRHLSARASIKITILDSKEAVAVKAGRSIKECLRKAASATYAFLFCRLSENPSFIFRGNVDCMTILINEVKSKKYDTYLYDFEFRMKDFIYSLKNGMKYIVNGRNKPERSSVEHYARALADMMDHLKSISWFSYKCEDLSGIVCAEVLMAAGVYIETITSDSDFYSRMIRRGDIRGAVVSEDQSPYGSFFAACFKSHGIPVSCISHGYPIMGMPIDIEKQGFALSNTFIQSEYEKDLYVRWGWDEKKLHVTGKPVYDGLYSMKRNSLVKNGRAMRILFCGTTLIPFNPLVNMYGGGYYELEGAHTRKCLKNLLDAAALHDDMEIVIKPHYNYDRNLWADAVGGYKGKAKISLVPATADFLSVAATCHAMFTSCWSTAVIECLMLGMPVVRMDYTGDDMKSRLIPDDICIVNRDPRLLNKTISEMHTLFREGKLTEYALRRAADSTYIIGKVDGKSASRVMETIMQGKI